MAHIFKFQSTVQKNVKKQAHSVSSVINANPIHHVSHPVSTTTFQNPLSLSSCYICELWGKEKVEPLASIDTAQKGKVQVTDLGFEIFTLC